MPTEVSAAPPTDSTMIPMIVIHGVTVPRKSLAGRRVPAAFRIASSRFGYQIVNCAATISGSVWMIQPVQMLFEFRSTASPYAPDAASIPNARPTCR